MVAGTRDRGTAAVIIRVMGGVNTGKGNVNQQAAQRPNHAQPVQARNMHATSAVAIRAEGQVKKSASVGAGNQAVKGIKNAGNQR